MNENYLLSVIKNGENSYIEFKSQNVHNDSLAKEIVAFANTEGGKIYIGVEDNFQISGCDKKSTEERVINICRNNISPPINPIIVIIKYYNLDVIEITIKKGIHKPYKVKTNNNFYIRSGSVSIEPSNEELIRLFQESGALHFEVQTLEESTLEDIELLKFKNYCEKLQIIDVDFEIQNLLKNLKIIGAYNHPTFLGLLFFGKKIQYLIPQNGLEMVHFAGTEKDSSILDHKTEILNIPDLIEIGERFIKYNTSTKAVFNSSETRREDVSEYPEFVIRELLSNAFAHRDWSIFGQRVRIDIFRDRLEIFSPGKLPNTLELASAISGISYYRNPIISQMLKDYSLVEKSGRGLLKIINYYKKYTLTLPSFEATNYFFKVTLFPIR